MLQTFSLIDVLLALGVFFVLLIPCGTLVDSFNLDYIYIFDDDTCHLPCVAFLRLPSCVLAGL